MAKEAKTPKKEEAKVEVKKRKVLINNVMHNGKLFKKGESISAEDAKALAAVGLSDYIS